MPFLVFWDHLSTFKALVESLLSTRLGAEYTAKKVVSRPHRAHGPVWGQMHQVAVTVQEGRCTGARSGGRKGL